MRVSIRWLAFIEIYLHHVHNVLRRNHLFDRSFTRKVYRSPSLISFSVSGLFSWETQTGTIIELLRPPFDSVKWVTLVLTLMNGTSVVGVSFAFSDLGFFVVVSDEFSTLRKSPCNGVGCGFEHILHLAFFLQKGTLCPGFRQPKQSLFSLINTCLLLLLRQEGRKQQKNTGFESHTETFICTSKHTQLFRETTIQLDITNQFYSIKYRTLRKH